MQGVVLCILDGFGLGNEDYKYNAIFRANTPNIRRFIKEYPISSLKTSGLSVGLPEGQMGNSEVGHMTIGSGRVLMQDLPMISKAIETGDIWKKKEVLEAVKTLKQTGGKLHILGLCSEGGVHSHAFHISAVANFFAKEGVEVFIHAVSDGRDVAPDDFLTNLSKFEQSFIKGVSIASLCGRFFTMDRDNKLERTETGIELVLKGKGRECGSLKEAVESAYKQGETDEFIKPCAINGYRGASKNDILFFANFRADRARQGTEMLLEAGLFKKIFTMMPYSEEISLKAATIFKKEEIKNTLAEVISENNLKQLRIAETEKYAHVTFFFNGGKEEPVKGEERVIVPSPKVKTYDLKPEMSLPELEEILLKTVNSKNFQFIACNIANGDMVGHTGNFEAAKKAAERIDEFLGKMEKVILENNYTMVITADHGNLEEMLDESGKIHTQHTTGNVPFFIISKERFGLIDGSLANIAPTILDLLKLKIPAEMSKSLIVY